MRRAGDDLHAGLGALGIAVVVEQGQWRRGGGRELLPPLLHGIVMEAVGQGMKDDPRQCAVADALVAALEPLEFLDHLGGDAAATAGGDDLDSPGSPPQHARRLKAAFEGPHGVGMGGGFLRARGRGAILQAPQRAEKFIAIRRWVGERQWGFVSIREEQHW